MVASHTGKFADAEKIRIKSRDKELGRKSKNKKK